MTIKRTVQIKEGKVYKDHFTEYDQTEVYRSLSHDMVSKKLCNCSYIRSIKRVNNYDGTVNITVTYDNECRSIYTVEA